MNIATVSMEDAFRRIFKQILSNTPSPFGIQIGAFDGVNFDETQFILKELNFPFLFVEPIEYYFNKMVQNLNYSSLNKFDKCAVANEDGETFMALYDPVSFYENQPMSQQFCLTGMSSLYPIRNKPWQPATNMEPVKTKRLSTLLSDNDVRQFNVFLCDTEGFDYEIFKQVKNTDISSCLFWRFEIQHLLKEETYEIVDFFQSNEYSIFTYHTDYPVYTDNWPAYQSHACHDLTAINNQLLESVL